MISGGPGGPGNQRKSGGSLVRLRNLFLCGSFSGTLQISILNPTKQESGPESSRAAAAGRPKSPESRTPPEITKTLSPMYGNDVRALSPMYGNDVRALSPMDMAPDRQVRGEAVKFVGGAVKFVGAAVKF